MDPIKQDTAVSPQRSSPESQELNITQILKPEVGLATMKLEVR